MRSRIAACAALALGLVGCGPDGANNTAGLLPIKGTLSKNGSPVAKADITFFPASAGAVQAGAAVANGQFTPLTGGKEGLAPGKYKVTVKGPGKTIHPDSGDEYKTDLEVEAKSGADLTLVLTK